jgi:response regulator RpfG family c-di-GMP phosphodiesterase
MDEKQSDTILCLDDEKNILNSLRRLLRKEGYNLLLASSGEEAFKLLEENEVQLVISDQRMPEMNGTEFLAKVKERYPDILRIILTGYTDVDSITESINKGHIYKFFLKPWNDQNLKLEIRQALDQFALIRDNKRLDKTVVAQNEKLKEINENLENLVDERTRKIATQNQALEISHAILEDLPMPILGIDSDGIIILANKMAQARINENGVKLGVPLSDYFCTEAQDALSKVVDEGQSIEITGKLLSNDNYQAILLPLSGRFHGKGAIMTISG